MNAIEILYIKKARKFIVVEILDTFVKQARGFQFVPRIPKNFGYKFSSMPVGSVFHMKNVAEPLHFIGVANGEVVFSEVHAPEKPRVVVKGEDIYEVNEVFSRFVNVGDSVLLRSLEAGKLFVYKNEQTNEYTISETEMSALFDKSVQVTVPRNVVVIS